MTDLRHERILEILNANGAVSVKSLTTMLYVSEATVRRDLAELEKTGALKRTRGGAKPVDYSKKQIPLYIREEMDSSEKNEICKKAALLIKDGDTIFIDGSSTVLHLVNHIAHLKDITVITYSIRAAELMCQTHIKTYCVGGLIMENSLVCVGQKTVEAADSFNVDICFLSCKGMSLDGRFSDTSEEETAVRRAFMKNAKKTVFLMTNNKIGNSYLHTLCDIDSVNFLISDGEIPEKVNNLINSREH